MVHIKDHDQGGQTVSKPKLLVVTLILFEGESHLIFRLIMAYDAFIYLLL